MMVVNSPLNIMRSWGRTFDDGHFAVATDSVGIRLRLYVIRAGGFASGKLVTSLGGSSCLVEPRRPLACNGRDPYMATPGIWFKYLHTHTLRQKHTPQRTRSFQIDLYLQSVPSLLRIEC